MIANALASVHNLVMLALEIFGGKLDCKGFRLVIITILDMVCNQNLSIYFFSCFSSIFIPNPLKIIYFFPSIKSKNIYFLKTIHKSGSVIF